MTTAQILEFPYARIRLEPEAYQAVILRMPERRYCPIAALPAIMLSEWYSIWLDMLKTEK